MAWPCPLLVVRRGTGQRVIPSADLEAEVLERLALLAERKGPRASATASIVANLGEKRSTGAVYTALQNLWERGEVEWCGEETFRRAVAWQPADAEQLGLEVEA